MDFLIHCLLIIWFSFLLSPMAEADSAERLLPKKSIKLTMFKLLDSQIL